MRAEKEAREKEGGERERTMSFLRVSGKPENEENTGAVAARAAEVHSLETGGELYRRLLGLIVFLGIIVCSGIARPAKHKLNFLAPS